MNMRLGGVKRKRKMKNLTIIKGICVDLMKNGATYYDINYRKFDGDNSRAYHENLCKLYNENDLKIFICYLRNYWIFDRKEYIETKMNSLVAIDVKKGSKKKYSLRMSLLQFTLWING